MEEKIKMNQEVKNNNTKDENNNSADSSSSEEINLKKAFLRADKKTFSKIIFK